MSDGSVFIGFKGESKACHLARTLLYVCLERLMNRLLSLIREFGFCLRKANGTHVMNIRPSHLANTWLPISVRRTNEMRPRGGRRWCLYAFHSAVSPSSRGCDSPHHQSPIPLSPAIRWIRNPRLVQCRCPGKPRTTHYPRGRRLGCACTRYLE